jgi:hypothetical protein
VHGKPPEVNTSALDVLLAVELEALAVEEWPTHETGESGDPRSSGRTQRGFDALVEAGGDTATSKFGMSEKVVEQAVVGVGSEACENSVELAHDNGEARKAAPASGRHQVELAPTPRAALGNSTKLPKNESTLCKSP